MGCAAWSLQVKGRRLEEVSEVPSIPASLYAALVPDSAASMVSASATDTTLADSQTASQPNAA